MKKFILTVLLLMTMGISVHANENTILYSDFEAEDQYFQNSEYASYTGLEVSSDDTEVKKGAGSLKINVTEENSSLSSKLYNISEVNNRLNTNDKYYLSFYAKVPEGSNITGIEAAYSYYRSLRTTTVSIDTQEITGTDFVKVSMGFTIKNTGRFTIILKPQGTGTIYIDELVLERDDLPKILKNECIPADGSVGVLPSDEIFVQFNKEIDESTIEGNFEINNSADLIDVVTLSGDKKSCTVKLKQTMEYNTEYTLSINGLTDTRGNEIADSIVFTTIDNTAEMKVLSMTLAEGAEDVETTGRISVKFSADVDEDTLDGAFLFNGSSEPVEEFAVSKGKMVVVSYSNLDEFKEYTFGIQNVKDIFGNIVAPKEISFSTGAKSGETVLHIDWDETLPEKTSSEQIEEEKITTQNGYLGKSLKLKMTSVSSYDISAKLEKDVLYKYSVMLSSDTSGASLKWGLSYGDGTRKALMTSADIPAGEYKQYEGTIFIPSTDSVSETFLYAYDANGIFYIDDLIITREPDFKVLDSSYPVEGEENVDLSEPIKLRFKYPVSQIKNVKLNNQTIGTSDIEIDGKTVYIYNAGRADLAFETKYTLKVGQIIDSYGRTIRDFQRTFTTKKEVAIASATLEKNGNLRTLKLSQVVNNTTDQRKLILMILVLKDGDLLACEEKLLDIAGSETIENDEVTFDLGTVSQTGYTVKATVWDAENGIMPIIKHIE